MLYNHEGHEEHEGENIKSLYFMLFMSFMVKISVKLLKFQKRSQVLIKMANFALFVYNLLFPFLFLLYFPVYLVRLSRRGNFADGFGERFGFYSTAKKQRLAALKQPVWIHSVSVGETVAALSFIESWMKTDENLEFVISTTTSTGQKIARDRAPGDRVVSIYFPLDFSLIIRRAFSAIRPRALIIFEVEIWPNIVELAYRHNIKSALVNCRMSDNSARGYRKHRWFFEQIFSRFSVICTQSQDDCERVRSIVGTDTPVKVCNTMKFDQLPAVKDDCDSLALDRAFGGTGKLVFTAASTHPGEEAAVTGVYQELAREFTDLRLVIIPRHVERTPEIERLLASAGVRYTLLTTLRETLGGDADFSDDVEVLIVNTTGEMMKFLDVSDVVFMGNSLAGNRGGHNIIEPAILGKPIIFGAGMENFRLVTKQFKDKAACIEVADELELRSAVGRLLEDESERARLGRVAKETVEQYQGATASTISLLREYSVV